MRARNPVLQAADAHNAANGHPTDQAEMAIELDVAREHIIHFVRSDVDVPLCDDSREPRPLRATTFVVAPLDHPALCQGCLRKLRERKSLRSGYLRAAMVPR